MRLTIIDIDKFIKVNEVQKVTNPVLFNSSFSPTEDGIFSRSIFGSPGSYDRKTLFGYIDLKEHYFHPVVYKNLIRINRLFGDCMNGIEYCSISPKGELVRDENGDTGIKFLYENWDKIKFKKTSSNKRDERLNLISSLSKEEIFITKWLVIPAFYRDFNLDYAATGKIKHDEINDYYCKLLRLVSVSETSDDMFVGGVTRSNVQQTIVAIYDFFTSKIARKDGFIHQAVLGKSTDYSARLVISTAKYNNNTYKNTLVDYYYSGIPMAYCAKIFEPFTVKWIQDFFLRQLFPTGKLLDYDLNAEYTITNLDEVTDSEYIIKQIDLFRNSPTERFNYVTVQTEESGEKKIKLPFKKNDEEEKLKPLTWTDLLYIAVTDVVKDKHCIVTRYPYLKVYNSTFCRVHPLGTHKSCKMVVMGNYTYDFYPDYDPNCDKDLIANQFIDVLQPANIMLGTMDADFDGDQVTCRGLFSKEANKEAERIMHSKSAILGTTGDNQRGTKGIGLECITFLTRD